MKPMIDTKKMQWQIIKDLAEIVQTFEAIIFGGFNRDRIIHDHFAKLFYDACDLDDSDDPQDDYGDCSVHSETRLRLLIPKDIDCYMLTSAIPNFLLKLQEYRYAVKILKEGDAVFYIKESNISENIKTLQYTKIEVSLITSRRVGISNNLNTLKVEIDILHAKILNVYTDIRSEATDFECNAIHLSSDNIYFLLSDFIYKRGFKKCTSPVDKLKKLSEIIKDVINQEAVIVDENLPNYRINRIKNKGSYSQNWKVSSDNFTLLKDKKESHICCISLKTIAAGGRLFQ